METTSIFREGETPLQQGWRDYQNMNANGALMAFRLAAGEYLNVLPETMLLMLKEKLQAMKSKHEEFQGFQG